MAGPARSGKTAALLVRYRQMLVNSPIGSGLWLLPTRHAAAEVRAELLGNHAKGSGLVGCFSPAVYTFQQFVQMVLSSADRPQRFVGRLLKRQLIERVLAEAVSADQIQHFAPIADRPGLVDLIFDLIADLKRQEVSPEKFAQSVARPPTPPRSTKNYRCYMPSISGCWTNITCAMPRAGFRRLAIG